jgi:uncharacterized repeat protein (TIGR03987 family)
MLLYAITFITLALVSYSVGVWSEKLQGKLKVWHLMFFYLGLVFDITGTSIMGSMAGKIDIIKFILDFHSITGVIAIILMFVHAFWATIVLVKKNEVMIKNFHKFSLTVWFIWLIPFVTGAIYK